MTVNRIEYKNFRNIEALTLEPAEGVNVIYGENAQGKTNLLEGIWLFSGLKSFRGAKDAELVRFGCGFGRLKMAFTAGGREQKADITVETRRKARLNGVELPSCTGLIGACSAVVFSPTFLNIVKNGPEERRRFLDAALCQVKPGYAPLLAEYNRLVRQRNSLLKDVQFEPALLDMLDVIDERMAQAGESLIKEREAYIEMLVPAAKTIHDGFSGGREEMSVCYVRKDDSGENRPLSDILKTNRRNDILNRTTSAGPHRDDIDIRINGISARNFGSQGQQRSCAVSLKLGEAAVMRDVTGGQPAVLLDDVMSELDSGRQDYILNHIKGWQVFITCCEPSTVLRMCSGKTFHIEQGKLIENSEL
ncbi:MAG: DNA replication/repair protein RecF [Clostridia bacterium]|nr:DNA replication/repair protein RecF [Clostridia bacterium]